MMKNAFRNQKDNQPMTFSQLIESNMRKIFFEKQNGKCGGEINSRPFSGKLKLSLSQ